MRREYSRHNVTSSRGLLEYWRVGPSRLNIASNPHRLWLVRHQTVDLAKEEENGATRIIENHLPTYHQIFVHLHIYQS